MNQLLVSDWLTEKEKEWLAIAEIYEKRSEPNPGGQMCRNLDVGAKDQSCERKL